MKCPTCDVELRRTERQGVEIDYCAQCRGVWLERGELDKIIEKSTAPARGAPGEPYEYEEPHDVFEEDDRSYRPPEYPEERRRGRPIGRRSFLRELFDFD